MRRAHIQAALTRREGGALIPTIVFGIPSSAGMAILLSAFLMHGLVPGPEMLTRYLNISYAMVWSIAIANLLSAGLCFLFSGQFARLATLRYTLVLPVVLSFVFLGAFEGKRPWGDLFALLAFGVLGWVFKHCKWPRPPLVLGFILGSTLERNMFISIQRYGSSWLLQPLVLALLALATLSLLRPLLRNIRRQGGARVMFARFGRPHFCYAVLLPVALVALFALMLLGTAGWPLDAKIIPLIVGFGALIFGALAFANELFKPSINDPSLEAEPGRHMDIGTSDELGPAAVLRRGTVFFLWLCGFMLVMSVIGWIPAVPLFITALMRVEGREPWRIILPVALVMTLLIYGVFDQLLEVPWPGSWLGVSFPLLKVIPSV